MFSYRPPKSSCWGHAIRPSDPLKAKQKVNAFFETYFERLDPQWDTTRQFTLSLTWNASALPSVESPDYLQQRVLFLVTGNRIMFAGGLWIPISFTEPTSYEFIRRFSGDAPFKMSAKHFKVGVLVGQDLGTLRKPDAEIAARLQSVLV
ncbi:MAG TPA: hypothetical protein VNN22_11700 [Verrucomicrobiae bacterium]|nr:hypothetical protein [Verrucomicrobiae bacterium]